MSRKGRVVFCFLLLGLGVAAGATFPLLAQNPIEIENSRPGNPETEWWLSDPVTETNFAIAEGPAGVPRLVSSNAEIEGYASQTSVDRGDEILFFVNTLESDYRIQIFRIGWYGGLGARQMMELTRPGQAQLPCELEPSTRLIQCNWEVSYCLTVPLTWVSGVYLAKLTAGESGKQSYLIFVVRDDARSADYLFQSSVTTYQAYNIWGGYNLYSHHSEAVPPARKVSFDRPYYDGIGSAGHEGAGEFFRWEVNMVRWLEQENLDVSYATNLDIHEREDLLLKHRAFLSVGHDEYWSWEMRENVERARDRCVSLGFFSANSVYWQIRLEPSSLTGAPNRTMVAYKDVAMSQDPLALDGDPSNNHLITTLWRASRSEPEGPSFVTPGRPEDALLGVMYAFWPVNNNDVKVKNTWNWVFNGTGLDEDVPGLDSLPGLVGYEADRAFANAPPGTLGLAQSPITRQPPPNHYDCFTFALPGIVNRCEHNMALYPWPSGALGFATGTIQWSWGLDDFDLGREAGGFRGPASDPAKRVTRNVLDAFLRTQCIPQPGGQPPPLHPALVAILVEGGSSVGEVSIVECIPGAGCGSATRPISSSYPSAHIYYAEEFTPSQPNGVDWPERQGFRFLGPLHGMSTTAPAAGPAWITISYDDSQLPAGRETDLALLQLVQTQSGAGWEDVTVGLNTEVNLIQARTNELSWFAVALAPLQVEIAVKPGSDSPSINLGAAGVIPVAILSSSSFDATTVNPDTVTMAGARVRVTGKGDRSLCHTEDVNNDGMVDQICQLVNLTELQTVGGDSTVVLEAETFDGTAVRGAGTVRIVPEGR